jgi:ribosome-associated toxin RatA of RatAB toxin-antitoxin module
MREVRRSALLPYPPDAIYGLVADIERYPEFLPWCRAARIRSRDGEEVIATLAFASGPARASFTTRNRHVPGRSVTMSLVDGPFESLEGRWDFTPVGDAGTRAELGVRFATSGVAGALVLGPAFEAACDRLVDAFARRARQVFGGA